MGSPPASTPTASAAGNTCSKLSSITSVCALRSRDRTRSVRGLLPISWMPSASATALMTRPGSRTLASATNTTPSAKTSPIPAATSIARRVLPMPPGPSKVTRRSAASTFRTTATCCSRPTKLLSGVGSGADARPDGVSRRTEPRRPRLEHRAVGVRQAERLGQTAHGRRVGVRPGAPLEVGDTARAHRRALGERLLGQPGRDAVAAEDVAEPGFLASISHRASASSPRRRPTPEASRTECSSRSVRE